MAVIAPQITLCTNNLCNLLTITDVTGMYNASTNPKGWGNTQVATGVETSELVSSRVTLINVGTSAQLVYYLKTNSGVDLYPAEATPEFAFDDFTWTGADGIYTVTLEAIVDSPHTTETFTDTILITCAAEACVRNLWKEFYNQCSCDIDGKLASRAMEAESLLAGVKAQFACNQNDQSTKILATLAKICAMYNSNCNCN